VQIINQIKMYMDEKNAQIRDLSGQVKDKIQTGEYPKLGILKLGTGNGWASVVGSKKPKKMLREMISKREYRLTRFNLVESEQQVFPFAGLGWDAMVLNDYLKMKQRFGKGAFKAYWNHLAGYITTLMVKSLPSELMRKQRPQVRVVNNSPRIFSVSHSSGIREMNIPSGQTLYEGPCNAAGAATTPNYGYHIKVYPFARRMPEYMNLRVIHSGALELVRNAKGVWMGTYESEGIQDFLARDVTLEFSEPMPFQIGGDACGYRERVRFRVSDFSVEVIDMS